jgi:hypothetical protein
LCLGAPVPSRERHVLSDVSDLDNTPLPVVAKDQADDIPNVVPYPIASAAGVPGLPREPGVTHPPCKGGDIDRQPDSLASSVHPNEPGLSTMPVIQCVYVYACTFAILIKLALSQGCTCGNT